MEGENKSINMAFSQQQRTQISNACERVQNAININNSTLAVLNDNLVRKAEELALKLEGEIGTSPNSRQAIEEAFLEMAALKDKEMQETIEVAEDHAFFAGSCREREKFAWEIHEKIVNGATVAEIDNYVCGICDF